eukprot:gene8984-biopygen3382
MRWGAIAVATKRPIHAAYVDLLTEHVLIVLPRLDSMNAGGSLRTSGRGVVKTTVDPLPAGESRPVHNIGRTVGGGGSGAPR